MDRFILFLHLLSSTAMGFYLVLPFLVGRLTGKAEPALAGVAGIFSSLNRIGQFMLIVQFLTGGYLVGKSEYSYAWMGLAIVLLLAIAALAGIMGKPLRQVRDSLAQGHHAGSAAGKVRTFSMLIGVLYLVALFFMKYPDLL